VPPAGRPAELRQGAPLGSTRIVDLHVVSEPHAWWSHGGSSLVPYCASCP
jgi:hypothetical protein